MALWPLLEKERGSTDSSKLTHSLLSSLFIFKLSISTEYTEYSVGLVKLMIKIP